MQLQLDILSLLNWLDFCFKALLSSYSVMCSPWRPLPAIKSPAKSKLTTTNYISSWQLPLYYKIDGDPSEISRTSVSKLSSLGPGTLLASTLMMVDDDMLVWHTPKLYTCSLYWYVSWVYSPLPLFCLSTQSFSLAALICYCYLHHR